MVNLDTSTGIAFISEGSPVRDRLREYVGEQQMVMAQTAFDEFTNIIHRIGGTLEKARANRLNLETTINLGANDIIILGTADRLGIVTMTADAKAIRAAEAQGVDFLVYLHVSCPLTGN